jgi:hypothetical protein
VLDRHDPVFNDRLRNSFDQSAVGDPAISDDGGDSHLEGDEFEVHFGARSVQLRGDLLAAFSKTFSDESNLRN